MKHTLRILVIGLCLLIVMSSLAQAATEPLFEASVALAEGSEPTQFSVFPSEEHAADFPDDPACRLQITPPDGQMYTLLFPSYESAESDLVPLLRFADMNEDGFLDVEAVYILGASNLTTTYYLYDPADGKLHYAAALGVLSNAFYDAELGIILSQNSDGAATRHYTLFDVREGVPVLTRTALMDATVQQGDGFVLITQVKSESTGEFLLDETTSFDGDESAVWNTQYEQMMQTLLEGYGEGLTPQQP